uniref:Dihydroorotate dehydrogenase (Fumarate) n=2 Tax=unclassified Candidatus Kentrum TaxID=2643149 RepID=A0A451AYY6_9GAMM|nr:MAG: dihydroorotate dehydrogenase (fumarate) [Candidatus Kentron sp. LPFa]VFK15596.1 MAG: dihydroorotate dehydrogenase (fumarate) [Candidatus Kentron sp. LPFa]VFK30889.1 MAG: dihydroorotate dehydrogenase (fumarate) [Candidatus Kentron sp. LPFa]VFK64844.1 MAG: dihydroorotate dehydrogenase (fumarate) [Candidatus Kentron sp. UNK]VFK71258.1 MAG: dihydroorotate dehydrogenase (fumarate) [Candidatus Kentron sp. UNK]
MDLRTTYMGMELKHPIVASASPLWEDIDNIKQAEDAGASALVMFSLFEEQLKHEAAAMEHFMSHGTESFPEALSYFPTVEESHHNVGADRYLDILHRASEAVEIPIIGSLNGVTNEGWIDFAKDMEEAGASGIELNVYYIPTDIYVSSHDVEQRYLEILQHVKQAVSIPVAMKMSAYFSSLGHIARQFNDAGADALVLFNRFYRPDFDIDNLEVVHDLRLSNVTHIRSRLLWIAILHGHINASIAATTGVNTHIEVIKYLMAGADAVMTTAALLRNGIEYLETLVNGLAQWMEKNHYVSVEQMKGSMSRQHVADPTGFERASYIRILDNFKSPYVLS